MSKKIHLVFDGENLIYPVACIRDITLDERKRIVDERIFTAVALLGGIDITICFSCSRANGFRRKLIDPNYKSNRNESVTPEPLPELIEYLEDQYHTIVHPGLEADDICSILATTDTTDQVTICGTDKDYLSTPGTFFDMGKGTIHYTDPIEANFRHMMQTLAGDSSDGYKGIPRVGAKKAYRILGLKGSVYESSQVLTKRFSIPVMWERVIEAYKQAGMTEEDALRNARLAYLLRASDFNAKTGKIKLWNPYDKR